MAWSRFMDFVRRSILPVSAGLFLTAGSANAGIMFTKTPIGGFDNPAHILSADLNNDNRPDLAVANWNGNSLTILLRDGLGGYSVASTLTTAIHPNFIAAGDFNNNGSLDLAVTNGGTRAMSLFLNNGNGTEWTASTVPINTGADLTGVVAGKFSSDNNIDLFFTLDSSTFHDRYEVWQGNGSGLFSNITNGDTGDTPLFAASADFNGDAILDMAVANYASGSLSILLGNGNGTFAGASEPSVSVGLHPSAIAAGNLNGDSHPDLAVSNSGDNTVSILLGNGDGTFTQGTAIVSGGAVTSPAIADFDGDGANDIAISRYSANTVTIFRGNGDGTFQPVAVDITGVGTPGSIAISDLNGDGSPDLAVTSSASNSITLLMNVTSLITDGLVSLWRGEGNAFDAVGGNNGTLNGSPSFIAGKVYNAFSFDGSDDYISIPASDSLKPTDAITLSAWIYPRDTSTDQHIISTAGNGPSPLGHDYYLRVTGGGLEFRINDDPLGVGGVLPSPNQWYHVVATYDQSTSQRNLYVNGILVGTNTYVNAINTGHTFVTIGVNGRRMTEGGFATFNGNLDEVAIYNRALSSKEVLRMYDPNGPVSWWRGEDSAGDSAGDNDGDLQGSATFAAGKEGRAFSFSSATSDGVTVESSADLNPTEAITMSAWIMPTATANPWPNIISKRSDSGNIQYSITISDRNTFTCDLTGAGVSAEGGTVPLNQWSHVACTYDRNMLRLYVNGEQVASAAGTAAIATGDEPLAIGMMDGSDERNFDGLIDEVKIYARALSAKEVASSYGLVSLWRAEDNALDSVGGNHGTWSGTPAYAPGISGEALSLNGNSEVTVPAFNMGDDWTISAWINPHSCSDGSHCPILARSDGNLDGLLFTYLGPGHGSANQFALDIGNGSGWPLLLYSGSTYSMDQWHHVVASKSGDTYTLYVDGVLKNQKTVTEVPTSYQSKNIEIGHWAYGAYNSGLIDEMMIYNRALSSAEVLASFSTSADTTPDDFSFDPVTGAARSATVESESITVGGTNIAAAISITGGEYRIDSGDWTSGPGTVSPGASVRVHLTSSTAYSATRTATLTIGGVEGTFSVTTITAPAAFSDDFASGLDPAHWTVNPGAYSIDTSHGDIRMSKPSGPGEWGRVHFNHVIYGDFDISVDYRDAVLAGDHNQIQLNLNFGTQYAANRRENWDGSRYSVWLDPPKDTYGVLGSSDTSGTLRVTRVGSTVRFYANEVQIYQADFNNAPVTDLWLSLQNNGTEDAISVTFDNLVIKASNIGIPEASGLLSWWKGEGDALDTLGYNNGALAGGAGYTTGKVGEAFTLDGGSGSLDVGTWFTLQSFTISMWLNPGETQQQYADIIDNNHESTRAFVLQQDSWTTNRYIFGASLTACPDIPFNLTANLWTHVAITRDGVSRVCTVYLNGVPLPSTTGTTDIKYDGTQNLHFGRHDTLGRNWNGKLDEIMVYNRALSAVEASNLAGTYPDSYVFTPATGAERSTQITSESIQINGLTNTAYISISQGGEYEINGNGSGPWLSTSSSITPGSTVRVRLTSSSSYSTTTTVTLNIGGREGTFSVTTEADIDKPQVTAFSIAATEPSTDMGIAVTLFTATDNDKVSGYLITTSSTPPSSTASGWSASAPITFNLTSAGNNTLYAWAKDPAGNVSEPLSSAPHVTLQPVLRLTSTYYTSLQTACGDATSGETIKALAVTVPDYDVTISKTLTIKGGHADGYGSQPGVTTIQGTLTIGTGSLIADRVAIR